uniref:Uncharacterized protein n=1 Tax=Arundo donax TaxID=35708 RepID=A0A0A9BS71_ARUDO
MSGVCNSIFWAAEVVDQSESVLVPRFYWYITSDSLSTYPLYKML